MTDFDEQTAGDRKQRALLGARSVVFDIAVTGAMTGFMRLISLGFLR